MHTSNSCIEMSTSVVVEMCKQALQSLAIITSRTDKHYQDAIDAYSKQIHEDRQVYHALPWYKRWMQTYPYSIDLLVKQKKTKER